MTVPDVAALEELEVGQATVVLAGVIADQAVFDTPLVDFVRVPARPDAELRGDVWLVCRLDDGTLDPVAPPLTPETAAELIVAQALNFSVAGWTRPDLTCVVLRAGYAARIKLSGESFMPIARWNLRVLADACAEAADRRFSEATAAPDATAALRDRLTSLMLDTDGPVEPDAEPSVQVTAGGLLGEGWDDLDSAPIESEAATYYGAATLTIADHFVIRPVPADIRQQRLREDIEAGKEVYRGRFEIVDARSTEVHSVWRDGLEFEQDLATALTYQWTTPYSVSQMDDLYAFKGHIIHVEYPPAETLIALRGFDLPLGDHAARERMIRIARPLDTSHTLERRIKHEFGGLEELNRPATEAVVARHLPPPHEDLWGQMLTDAELRDLLSDGEYARWNACQADDPEELERYAHEAAEHGELTLDEWDGVHRDGRQAVSERRRELIPERVRRQVWRRDEGRCVQCGSNERLEYDHIIPWSRGGSDTARNLQLLCEPCNRRKGAEI